MECPLHRDSKNKDRFNPPNADTALAFAIHDQAQVLYALARIGGVDQTPEQIYRRGIEFSQGLDVLEVMIKQHKWRKTKSKQGKKRSA